MWKTLRNYFALLQKRDPGSWHPLLAVYYVTYACRFKCPYCSDGQGNPYPKLKEKPLDAADAARLLGTVRQYCDYLVLTGGEPLEHRNLDEILVRTKHLGFDGVILTTNGDGLDRILPAVNESVTHLVFSLDTLDPARADANFGICAGALDRLLAQIERAASWPNRRYEIAISSVVTPAGIADLYPVYRYSKTRGFVFAACPQLVGTVAHSALRDNPEYRDWFQFLVQQKAEGARITGTIEYLEQMRDLTQFECVPSATLAISPSGQVFYPCLEKATHAGNLLDTPDLNRLRREARARLGPEPRCGNQCHSACALSFSLLVRKPWITLREGYLQLLAAAG